MRYHCGTAVLQCSSACINKLEQEYDTIEMDRRFLNANVLIVNGVSVHSRFRCHVNARFLIIIIIIIKHPFIESERENVTYI